MRTTATRQAWNALNELLATYQQRIDSLRVSMNLLREIDADESSSRKKGVITAALAREAHRVKARPNHNEKRDLARAAKRLAKVPRRKLVAKKPKVVDDVARRLAQRTRTAGVLALFSETEPRPRPEGLILAPYINNGYLRKTDEGYLRTDKPFVIGAINGTQGFVHEPPNGNVAYAPE